MTAATDTVHGGHPAADAKPVAAPRNPLWKRLAGKVLRGLWISGETAAGDLLDAWWWRSAPPSIREIVKRRTPGWNAMPAKLHQCTHIPDRNLQGAYRVKGWLKCVCNDVSEQDSKDATTNIRVVTALRWGWIAWNHVVAIPLSVVLYAAAWILQHPARSGLAALAVAFIWGWS